MGLHGSPQFTMEITFLFTGIVNGACEKQEYNNTCLH